MTLSPGSKLGPYEITGSLGAGGMGEVYRAQDTNLQREVAIKTLPVGLAEDRERLARFEREARLLAALNHAHIASIYGLDRHEGTLYIAMELVEGETLEETLRRGALRADEALRLGLQITAALEAAHDKGVVHRDLKPANIMVTPEGQVKVLDFGLAKAFAEDPVEPRPAQSPTLSMAMTQQGIILGTAGYMSPEQASGQATDQRADVWAFGVVLYEMLTGLPPFSGESVPHILAAVLQSEPDWNRLPLRLHPRIRFLLERCLEKKARNRYHGIADARVDIEKILKDPEGSYPQASAAEAARAQPLWRRAMPIAAAVAFGGIIVGVAFWAYQPPAQAPIVSRLMLPQPEEHPFSLNGFNYDLAVSPDGTRIVYRSLDEGRPALVVHDIDSPETSVLRDGGGVNLFFSPDGGWLSFVDLDASTLYRVPITGGPPIEVSSSVVMPRGGAWGLDDEIIYAMQTKGLWRVPAGGGSPEQLTQPDESLGQGDHLWPHLLPGGHSILFTIYQGPRTPPDSSEIALRDLTTGEQRVLLQPGSDARYVPTGHLVYGYRGTLRAVPFDVEQGEITGNSVAVIDNIMTTPVGSVNAAISDNGTLVYVQGSGAAQGRALAAVNADGDEELLGVPPNVSFTPALSPDAHRLALVGSAGDNAETDIWIWSLADRALTRLTFEAGSQTEPLWSPDGERIVYRSVGEGLYSRKTDGTGNAEPLFATSDVVIPSAWSKEGDIIYQAPSEDGDLDIGVLSPGPDPNSRLILATKFDEREPALSPDGHWLAYASNETGRFEVYVRPFPDIESGGLTQVSTTGGREPAWTDDGRRIFFLGPGSIMVSDVTAEPVFRRSTPVAVLSLGDYRTTERVNNYEVWPDGSRFIVTRRSGAANSQIVVVQNWFEELKRLVPVD